MERFFGSLKSEWLFEQRYGTHQAARLYVVEYIEMDCNNCRLHSPLGYQSPREIELAALRLKNVSALS